jgi:hypothetical protein
MTMGLLGACGAALFYLRSANGKPAMNRLSGMWNSATGPGIASGGASLGKEEHGLGSGTRSPFLSKLSKAISAPFSGKDPADADTGASPEGERTKEMSGDGASAPRVGKDLQSGTVAERDKASEGDRKQPMAPQDGNPREDTLAALTSPSQGNPEGAVGNGASRGLGVNSPQGITDTNGAAAQSMSSSPPPESARGRLSGTQTQADTGNASPEAARGAVVKKMLVVVTSPSGQAAAGGAATAPYSTGGNAESTVQGADAGGDGAPALDPSASGGSSNGQSAGGNAQEAGGPAGDSTAGAASPSASDSYVAASVQAEVGASTKAASSAAKPPPKAPPKNANRADNPLPRPDAQQAHAGGPAKVAAEGAEAKGKPVDSSLEADSKKAAPRREVSSAIVAGVPPVGDPDKAESGSSSAHGAGSNVAVTAAATPRKPGMAPSATDQVDIRAQIGSAGTQGGATGIPPSLKRTVALVRVGSVRVSNWTSQVFKDIILPTRPEPVSEGDAVETMRADLKKEKLSRLPDSLRHPLAKKGFAIEYPVGPEAPEWRNVDGIAASSEVRGNRAELTFLAGHSPPSRPIVLAYRDGREVAQVSIDPDGTPVLNAAPGTHSWYWIGLVHPRTDGAFNWQVSSGGSTPAAWQSDDQWPGGPGQRIEIPIAPAEDHSNRYSVSLVDPSTGCGVTCAVALD